jgi:lipopolysaccharide transport system permease protein
VLEPVLNMLVFTAIFGVAAGLRTQLPEGLPYAVFVFAGLIAWKLFATALGQGGMSLVNSQNLLTKIYFPRLFVPTATVGGALVDMALQFVVFAGILAWYGFVPSWHIVFLPLLVALTVVLGLGAAYLLSALTITFRDFRFLIPVITQVWMYLSFVPIPVPKAIRESEKWQAILGCNPMYTIVALYRKCVTGYGYEVGLNAKYVPISVGIAVGLFVLGLFYFRRTERRFADIA